MKTWHPLSRLVADRRGNFGIITAVLAPIALGVGGIAIDLTKAVQIKSEIQALTDSAALAGASAMANKEYSADKAKELAQKFLASQLVNFLKNGNETDDELKEMLQARKDASDTSVTENSTTKGKSFEVKVGANYPMPLNPLSRLILGQQTISLAAASTAQSATESTNGISMYLALDRSGSMSFVTSSLNPTKSTCNNYTSAKWSNVAFTKPCYIRKIEALQTAAGAMFTSLNTNDPKGTLVRVGAAAYTSSVETSTSMAWGTANAATMITNLPSVPTGGTDASGAMTLAYNALKSSSTTESKAHTAKGNDSFNRFIVLMTDGEMTGNSATWNSSIDKTVRGQCDTAKADGIQIFTVAFMAPDKGKSLLNYCASASDYYYEPEDMTDLVAAFGEIAEKAAKATTRLTN